MADESKKPKGGTGKPASAGRVIPSTESLRDSLPELGRVTGTEDFKHKRGTGPVASYAKPPTQPKPTK